MVGSASTAGADVRLVDFAGRSVQVGSSLGKGGEGVVLELTGDSRRVAKIYHVPSRVRERKLKAMVGLGNPALMRMCAWPEYTVHTHAGGPVIGFVMGRAEGSSLSDLLGPGSRRAHFPQTSFLFVVRAAKNLAIAFNTAHAANTVIGDIKEVNAYVADDATVTLLDVDGFQVIDPVSREVFRTLTATPSHQPPELQGATDFSKLTRLPEQDAFGLAVLIFQLLFMGRHPFSGTPVTRVDLEIHDAIKARQFAWATDLPNRMYDQPPHTLGLAAVGSLAPLFTRAFLPTQPTERPSPAEWITALARYEQELRVCEINAAHAHTGAICRLCEVEVATGAVLFVLPRLAGKISAPLDLTAAWASILAVTPPGLPPDLPRATGTVPPSVPELRLRDLRRIGAVLILIAGAVVAVALARSLGAASWWVLVVGGVLAWVIWPRAKVARATYVDAAARARQRVDDLRRQWIRETGPDAFNEKVKMLELARNRLRALSLTREERLRELPTDLHQRQRDQFLRSHSIARARIEGIGAKQINTLRSFRIETAYDITEFNLGWVHAFGPKVQSNLAAWRREIERSFRFDPSKGVDSEDIRVLEQEFADQRAADEQLLRLGPVALQQLSDRAYRRRLELLPHLQTAQIELARAEANLKATT